MTFNFNPPDGYRNTTVYPTTPASEAEFRSSLMSLLDQIKNYLNGPVDEQLADITVNTSDISTLQTDLSNTNESVALKADKTYVDDLIAGVGDASPKGPYATLTDLQAAFPTGATGIYVVTADGKWYYWNGTAWTAGGMFQSTGIADGSVSPAKTSFMEKSSNLFDKTAITEGFSVAASGTYNSLTANASTNVSGIISVEPSTSYKMNSALTGSGVSIRAFLSNGNYNATLAGTDNGDGSFTITTNSLHAFIRFTYSPIILDIDTFMLVKGSTLPSSYEAFGYQLPEDYISGIVDRVSALEKKPVPTLHVPLRFDFVKGTVGEIFDFGVLDFEEYPIPYCLNLESSSLWAMRRSNNRFLIDCTASDPIALTKKFHLDDINDGTRIVEGTTVINIVDVIPNPATAKNIVIMGDSFVAFGDILSAFDTRMHTDYGLTNYQFVGRLSKNGIKHEGVAGFDWSNFTDSSSIFYNSGTGQLDFTNYMDTYCAGVNLDYMICIIGVNDFSNGHTIAEVETMATTFFNQLAADYPDCKVILVGQHRQPYSSYFNGDTFGVSKGKYMILLNELYYNLSQSLTNVSYVDMMAQFDYENGFTMADENVGRYATETKKYITDTTHPSADVGAKYYADGILAGFFAINQSP